MISAGAWNADKDTQCVDINKTGNKTARITVRCNAKHMTDRDAKMRTMAHRATPDDALAAVATLYSSFTSQGYTYATYVLAWS